MSLLDKYRTGKFLKIEDVMRPKTIIVARLEEIHSDLKGGQQLVLVTASGDRLSLNQTRIEDLDRILAGRPEEELVGMVLIAYVSQINFRGNEMETIRLKIPDATGTAPPPPPSLPNRPARPEPTDHLAAYPANGKADESVPF